MDLVCATSSSVIITRAGQRTQTQHCGSQSHDVNVRPTSRAASTQKNPHLETPSARHLPPAELSPHNGAAPAARTVATTDPRLRRIYLPRHSLFFSYPATAISRFFFFFALIVSRQRSISPNAPISRDRHRHIGGAKSPVYLLLQPKRVVLFSIIADSCRPSPGLLKYSNKEPRCFPSR